jgi:hypothetical protein
MRAVFESLGVHDVVTKSVGTSNPYNMIRATFDALGTRLRRSRLPSVAARRSLICCRAWSSPREAKPKPLPKPSRSNRMATIKIKQIGSPIRRPEHQRRC